MAFLSIGPFAKGHTLVIPKEKWGDYLFDLNDDQYTRLMAATKKVAALVEKGMDCDRLLMWLEGFEVPHVHVHLIPAHKGVGLRSMQPLDLSEEEFKAIQAQIVGE